MGQAQGHAQQDRGDGEEDERHGHDPWGFMDLVPDCLGPAELAPEGQAHQPEHVERGQPGDDESDRPDPLEVELERLTQDLVLREEAGERRDPGNGDGPDQHRDVGDLDLLAQAPHEAHVLLFVDRVDDRS
jgi:hypothetical protein